jgi:hypothetical protein
LGTIPWEQSLGNNPLGTIPWEQTQGRFQNEKIKFSPGEKDNG